VCFIDDIRRELGISLSAVLPARESEFRGNSMRAVSLAADAILSPLMLIVAPAARLPSANASYVVRTWLVIKRVERHGFEESGLPGLHRQPANQCMQATAADARMNRPG
jgi:hypothetical protein